MSLRPLPPPASPSVPPPAAALGRTGPVERARRAVTSALSGSQAGRFALDVLLALRGLVRGFRGENLHLRAAALTYVSVFSLVPLVTVGLVVLRVLHQDGFQRRLRTFLMDVLAPGVREESAELLRGFFAAESTTAVGSVGFLVLLWTASSLVRHLDGSLNDIWGVRRRRPILARAGIYLGLMVAGPVLAVALRVGATLVREGLDGPAATLVPALLVAAATVLSVGALTVLYLWAPHAHVRFRSALAGGLVAGVAWVGAKHAYAAFAAAAFQYNPLYGSLGALPLFLAWLYVSWLVVLSGARLSYAVEHASFRDSLGAFGDHPRARELVAARVALEATVAFIDAAPGPTPRELAKHLRVPESLVWEVVERLEDAHLLVRGKRDGVLPACDPAQLSLADVVRAVHGPIMSDAEAWETHGPQAPGFEELEPLFHDAHVAGAERLRHCGLMELARTLRPPTWPARPPAEAPAVAASGRNP